MSNVIEFPLHRKSDAGVLKEQIHSILSERGADAALIQYAGERAEYWFNYRKDEGKVSLQVNLPSLSPENSTLIQNEIQSGVDKLCSEFQKITENLKAQLILKDIEIFSLKSGGNGSI